MCSCLIAFSTSCSLAALSEQYAEQIEAGAMGGHIDMVLVLDQDLIMLAGKQTAGDKWTPLVLDGHGGHPSEGSHIGVATIRAVHGNLDLFFRLLVGQLPSFGAASKYSGFPWLSDDEYHMTVRYLTPATADRDPVMRKRRLAAYAQEARAKPIRCAV